MDPADRPEPNAAPAVKWLAPPWSVPSGRRPPYLKRLAEIAPLWAAYMAVLGTWPIISTGSGTAPWFEWPFAVFYAAVAVAALVYGLYRIATARSRVWTTAWMFPGLTGTPSARVWYGLAFVLPVAIVIATASLVLLTSSFGDLLPFVFSLAAWPAMATCVLMARRASNEPVRRTILAGLAPSYLVSTDWPRWWWSGSEWVGFHAAAPDDAVRSPDGSYWWCGAYWVALPALDKPWRAAITA